MGACFSASQDRASDLLNRPRYVSEGVLGEGKTGTMKLMKDRKTKELVAVKEVARIAGAGLNKNTEREVINHRKLLHPNIIKFHEVFMTDSHLCIVMEYASGGHLSQRIKQEGRLKEAEAKRLFLQLISGVEYCHNQGVFHRDLRLENLLLDGNVYEPNLKISGFGYSKSAILDSQPKTNVGSPSYTPPELLLATRNAPTAYDGASCDVWSCGVILYVMLAGQLPFLDPAVPHALTRKMMQAIISTQYEFPQGLALSPGCKDLISRVFVADPKQRISIPGIKAHPWLSGVKQKRTVVRQSSQSVDEIRAVVEAARKRRQQQQQEAKDDMYIEDVIEE
ncbi:hypothetical protein WJX72_011887 [[Myrmecia] bisecta]|uniref:Protein kinase domain-containing protein n=1 Tax=[Myrmecia] bisecta TaxID=41462 RepID=A0AAW1QH32_9CHLO